MSNDLLRRKRATDTTIATFKDKPFDWAKKVTCLHMAHVHLVNMGHKPPALPCVRSALGAHRALKKRGWASVADMLDAIGLDRVPGAAMLPGDLGVMESDEAGIGGIVICAGRLLYGWHEDSPVLVSMQPVIPLTSGWRL